MITTSTGMIRHYHRFVYRNYCLFFWMDSKVYALSILRGKSFFDAANPYSMSKSENKDESYPTAVDAQGSSRGS